VAGPSPFPQKAGLVATKEGEQKETGKQTRNTLYTQDKQQSFQVKDLDNVKFFEVRHAWFKKDFKSLPIYFKSVSV
jgi:hypothetical protein